MAAVAVRPNTDKPDRRPRTRVGWVHKPDIDGDPMRVVLGYPGYGRQPGENWGQASLQGSRVRTPWHQEGGVWVMDTPGGCHVRYLHQPDDMTGSPYLYSPRVRPQGDWMIAYHEPIDGVDTDPQIWAFPLNATTGEVGNPIFSGMPASVGGEDYNVVVGMSWHPSGLLYMTYYQATGFGYTGPEYLRIMEFNPATGISTLLREDATIVNGASFHDRPTFCNCGNHVALNYVGSQLQITIYDFNTATGERTNSREIGGTGGPHAGNNLSTVKWSNRFDYSIGGDEYEYMLLSRQGAGFNAGPVVYGLNRTTGAIGSLYSPPAGLRQGDAIWLEDDRFIFVSSQVAIAYTLSFDGDSPADTVLVDSMTIGPEWPSPNSGTILNTYPGSLNADGRHIVGMPNVGIDYRDFYIVNPTTGAIVHFERCQDDGRLVSSIPWYMGTSNNFVQGMELPTSEPRTFVHVPAAQ